MAQGHILTSFGPMGLPRPTVSDAPAGGHKRIVKLAISSFIENKCIILNICLNICLTMSFKTLTIKERVYQKLLGMKKENESFSDLFERLSNKNIDTLRKLRGTIEFKNKQSMLKDLYIKRKEKRYG